MLRSKLVICSICCLVSWHAVDLYFDSFLLDLPRFIIRGCSHVAPLLPPSRLTSTGPFRSLTEPVDGYGRPGSLMYGWEQLQQTKSTQRR